MSRRNYYTTEIDSEDNIEVTDVTEEIEESISDINTITGIVIDCKILRVRNAPGLDSDIICEIEAGSIVEIDEVNSTEEFYKVCTETGIDGYCMKKFIKVES